MSSKQNKNSQSFGEEDQAFVFDEDYSPMEIQQKKEEILEMKDLMNEDSKEPWKTNGAEFFSCQVEDEWFLHSILSPIGPIFDDQEMDDTKKTLKESAIEKYEPKEKESVFQPLTKRNEFYKRNAQENKNREKNVSTNIYFDEDEKDETKNIPKNFGKEIIRFVKVNKELIQEILVKIGSQVSYQTINSELQSRKKKMNQIKNLKSLWTQLQFSSELRVISDHFLRKRCLHWIYNSRIERRFPPLKYRLKLQQAIKSPFEFRHLKSQ